MKEKFKNNIQLSKIKQNEVEIQSKNNWLDKLKPCPKNAIIKDKIFNSLNNSNINISKEVDKNKKNNNLKELIIGNIFCKKFLDEKIINAPEIFSSKNTNISSGGVLDKWETYLNTIKKTNNDELMNDFFELNFEDQSVVEKGKADMSFSMMSENIDEINHLIGKYF